MESNYIAGSLHDFFPLINYRKDLIRKYLLLASILILIIIYALYLARGVVIGQILLVILGLGFGVLLIITLLSLRLGEVATNWDDVDYTGLIKRNFPFKTQDGTKFYAYIYYPTGFDFEQVAKRGGCPALIGLHGWGSHHREMDRYCLPSVLKQKWLYFSFDCVGQGQMTGIGTKNDLRQFDDTAQFIEAIKSLPFVNKSRIGVVGMSMGAARAAVTAYPDPDIKVVVMLSGPYNFKLTMAKMTRFVRFLFWLGGNKFPKEERLLEKYSGYNYFKKEGIILSGGSKPMPNSDRIFLAADEHDNTVNVANTIQAIELLGLPPENYRIFTRGDHCFEGNEYFLAVDLYEFLIHHL